MVYEECIDLKSIERYFDRAFKHVCKSMKTRRGLGIPLPTNKNCHSIFLISRQIYHECVGLISKRSVNFHHGLLRNHKISNVMSESILQNVHSITITTSGHPALKRLIEYDSWHGHLDLITDLSRVLAKGHKLKNLTIDLTDETLEEHFLTCWYSPIKCDYREHIQDATKHLNSIRGVDHVTILGLPAPYAAELKRRMESTPKPKHFLALPGEIRNKIYSYSASYSDPSTHLSRAVAKWAKQKNTKTVYPPMSTPTIFLLNKQLYREASYLLHNRTLHITCPSTTLIKLQTDVPDIFNFISRPTFQSIRHLSLRLDSWEWIYAIERLLALLVTSHNLQSFRLDFRDALKKDFVKVPTKIYPDKSLATCLRDLGRIEGVGRVEFVGDLPEVYTEPTVVRMTAPRGYGRVLGAAMAVRGGKVVGLEFEA